MGVDGCCCCCCCVFGISGYVNLCCFFPFWAPRKFEVAYSTSKHRQKSAPKDTPPEHLSDIVRMEELLCERAPRLVNLGGGSQIFFHFHPYLGKIPILTNAFQMGWFNHSTTTQE